MKKRSQASLNEANERFRNALIPSAEAVATVAKNVRDVLQAVDSMIGMNKEGYQEALTDAKNQIRGWVSTVQMNYKKGAQEIKKEIEKSSTFGKAAKKWLQNILNW